MGIIRMRGGYRNDRWRVLQVLEPVPLATGVVGIPSDPPVSNNRFRCYIHQFGIRLYSRLI